MFATGFFPDEATVRTAMDNDDPLLVLVSYDRKELFAACVDDALEHSILLAKLGRRETEIDSFFRIVLNKGGADWTFACPVEYKNIPDREHRISQFYSDGIEIITEGILALGYNCKIDIPSRYRRHLKAIGDQAFH